MPTSPQDAYARLLSSPRGYPLWTPEPSNELLIERRDGLRIGDVGVVTDDGGFDVFFNICLPPDHPFHRRHGVPEGFTCISPGDMDIRTIPNAEYPGRTILSTSVTRVDTADLSSNTPQRCTLLSLRERGLLIAETLFRDESSALTYRFTLSSDDGALLVLPKGAERYDLLTEGLFLEQASRHGAEWYKYAIDRRHRIINHDSLYLITGYHKALSWSVAAFENAIGSDCHTANFKRVEGYNSAPMYRWETTCALDWRVGPHMNYDFANQAVFIRGFKIALRTGLLGTQRISVEADFPSTRSNLAKSPSIVPGGSRLLGGLARSLKRDRGNNVSRTTSHNQEENDSTEEPQSNSPNPGGYDGMYVEIQRVPDVPVAFHPSDAINQYLLCKEPAANIAITYDSHWMSILEDGLLTLEDFMQESRLESVLSQSHHIVSHEGVVHLERNGDGVVSDPGTSSEGQPSLTVFPHEDMDCIGPVQAPETIVQALTDLPEDISQARFANRIVRPPVPYDIKEKGLYKKDPDFSVRQMARQQAAETVQMAPTIPTDIPGLFTSLQYHLDTRAWHDILPDDATSCKLVRLEFCKAEGDPLQEFLVLYFTHPTHITARAVVIVNWTVKKSAKHFSSVAPQNSTETDDSVHVMGQEEDLQQYLVKTYGQYNKLCVLKYSLETLVFSPSVIQLSTFLLVVTNHRPLYNQFSGKWFANIVFVACKELFLGFQEECIRHVDHGQSRFDPLTLQNIYREYHVEWERMLREHQDSKRRVEEERKASEAKMGELERRLEEEQGAFEVRMEELERRLGEERNAREAMMRELEQLLTKSHMY